MGKISRASSGVGEITDPSDAHQADYGAVSNFFAVPHGAWSRAIAKASYISHSAARPLLFALVCPPLSDNVSSS